MQLIKNKNFLISVLFFQYVYLSDWTIIYNQEGRLYRIFFCPVAVVYLELRD